MKYLILSLFVLASSSVYANPQSVNDFWNKNIKSVPETGPEEVWQSPIETWTKGTGDCEDFAIAKYFHLLSEGYSQESLKLGWILLDAKYYEGRKLDTFSHMVLFYTDENKITWVLDNFEKQIIALDKRKDIALVRATFSADNITYFHNQNNQQPPRWNAILKEGDTYINFMRTTAGISVNPMPHMALAKK